MVTRVMVIDYIKDCGEAGCTVEELSEHFGIKKVSVNTHLANILKLEPSPVCRKWDAKGFYRYFVEAHEDKNAKELQAPVNVRIDDPVPEVSKHKPNQNHEGYNDPTATEAIKRMERNGGFMPGGIYKTTSGDQFLVVRTYPDTILGFRIDMVAKAVDTDSEVAWKVGANCAIVHTHRVCSMSAKRLLLNTMQRCPFESFRDILRKSPFNQCKAVEIPVENENSIQEEDDEIEQWKNTATLLRKQYEELDYLYKDLETMYTKCNEDRDRYLDILDQVWSELALTEDNTYNDIVEAVKTLKENSVDTRSIGTTIHVLRREASIWKYAFDKVTGGTISENLD